MKTKLIIEIIEGFIIADAQESKLYKIQEMLNSSIDAEYNPPYNSTLLAIMEHMGINRNDESDIVDTLFRNYDHNLETGKGESNLSIAQNIYLDWTNIINKHLISDTKVLTILK